MTDATDTAIKMGLVQMQMAAEPDLNLDAAINGVREAVKAGAQLVCLPELFRTYYFCQSEDPTKFELAEAVPGPTTETLGALALDLGVVVPGEFIVTPLPAAGTVRGSGPASGNGFVPTGQWEAHRRLPLVSRRLASCGRGTGCHTP